MLNLSRLDLSDAIRLIEGAVAHAADIGVPMCVSVVDESGHTIAFQRMDGAKVLSVRLSDDKAYTAAVSRRGTHEYNEICVPGNLVFGIHTAAEGRFSTVGGGLPVRSDDESVVGAVGCSGGTPEQDMDCARAGIAYWKAPTDNDVS
jgi:uncharacterized protein GlcG (DUF336 family)